MTLQEFKDIQDFLEEDTRGIITKCVFFRDAYENSFILRIVKYKEDDPLNYEYVKIIIPATLEEV